MRPSATTILYPVRAGEIARIGPAEVRARYGVEPQQVPDFIALRGDPSDRLPGVPGVGPQGAAGILRTYGSLEAALKAGRFPALAEAAAAVPVDRHHGPQGAAAAAARSTPDLGEGGRARSRLAAHKLAERLAKLAAMVNDAT